MIEPLELEPDPEAALDIDDEWPTLLAEPATTPVNEDSPTLSGGAKARTGSSESPDASAFERADTLMAVRVPVPPPPTGAGPGTRTPTGSVSPSRPIPARGSSRLTPAPTIPKPRRATVGNAPAAVAGTVTTDPADRTVTNARALVDEPPPRGTESTVQAQGTGVLAALTAEAAAALEAYERELVGEDDPARIGRLHHEIGRIWELVLGDPAKASQHYARALSATPEALPVIVAARRLLLAQGEYGNALHLFERELRVTADPVDKAALLLLEARTLEDPLQQPSKARDVLASANALTPSDPVLLTAEVSVHAVLSAWKLLADSEGRLASSVEHDRRLRAALVVRRARLHEVELGEAEQAAQLYEAALAVDPTVDRALEALKRLHHERKRWRELIGVHTREAEQTRDPAVRMLALHRIGHLQAERLGNRAEGIAALDRAAALGHDAVFVLEALARLYERAREFPALVETLGRLAEATQDPYERLGHLHRIGDLCRDELGDEESAMTAYQAALEIDPSYVPALRALAPMLSARQRWEDLVRMHEAELAATRDTPRRAATHARAAEILERMGQHERAVQHHEHALTLDPESLHAGIPAEWGESFRALERLYTQAQAHHKRIELYERAIDRVDVERKIEYAFSIADVYGGPLGQPEQAEATYRRILEWKPGHLGAVHAWQRLAEASGRHRSLVQALELETTIIHDKQEIALLLYRAATVLHEHLQQRSEAVARFKRVLELDGHHRGTLASLGRIYYADGHWADLVEIYRLELDVTAEPASKVALLYKIGELHARALGQVERAIQSYRQALAIDPRHGPSIQALSTILRERSDWRALVKLAEDEQAHARDPIAKARAAVRAGEIYEDALDDKTAAERAYAQAVSLDPRNRPAAEALVRVRTQLQHWAVLAEELEASAHAAEDRELAIAKLLRAGETWSDRVRDPVRALGCYVQILEHDPDHLAALLASERLQRQTQAWEAVAATLAEQERVFEDPGAKAAALVERARVLERHRVGTPAELAACYERVLELRPGDRIALEGLERLALQNADLAALAAVDAHLAEATRDPELQAAYLTRRAEALEALGHDDALAIYRHALARDRGNRAAQRGLARVAERVANGRAMAEAAELAAHTAKSPRDAAQAWVRSADIHAEVLHDPAVAVRHYETALGLYPDHVEAAERLAALLRGRGDHEALVERLSRAAAEARQPARQAELYLEVSRIHAKELANPGAALVATKRLCDAQPQNAVAWLEQARLLAADRRFDETVVVLERAITLPAAPELRFEAEVLLGHTHEQLDDAEAAYRHYTKALELRPEDQPLLARFADLQLRKGAYAAAVASATRLVQLARDDKERVLGLVTLARSRAATGHVLDAIDFLAEAIALGGLESGAPERVGEIATRPEHWDRYLEALRRGLRGEGSQGVALHLEIARVQHQRLGATDAAMATLIEGLHAYAAASPLRFELGRRLEDVGRVGEAVEQFQYLLMDDVVHVEGWRHLAACFGRLGQLRERDMVESALVVLAAARPDERTRVLSWQSASTLVPPGSFTPDAIGDLFVARSQQVAAAELLATIGEGLAKVRPFDLGRYGVSARDKLPARTDLPLRGIVDHVASVVGFEEFDVYVHRQAGARVIVENGARPTVLVPATMLELPHARQVFHLAYALFNAVRGVHPIDLFHARELGILLAAATHAIVPGYTSPLASADMLEEHGKAIARAISRRRRKAFEVAAEAYARAPALDTATFMQWTRQTSRRVALLFADDLVGAIEELGKIEDLGPPSAGPKRVKASPVLADLLRVWVSKSAMGLRQRARLIPVEGPRGPSPVAA